MNIENSITIHNINTSYFLKFLFFYCLIILYPSTKTILTSTKSVNKVRQIIKNIDNEAIYLFSGYSSQIHASTYFSTIEDNPIFIISEIAVKLQDSTLTELLQRHLLQEHLLVGQVNPVDRSVSERARRIDNALKFLKLVEYKAGSVEAVEQIIDRILKEA